MINEETNSTLKSKEVVMLAPQRVLNCSYFIANEAFKSPVVILLMGLFIMQMGLSLGTSVKT